MKENIIKLKGLNNSQEILLALVEQGLSREKAYKIVQKASLDTLSTNKDFSKILQNNKICLKKQYTFLQQPLVLQSMLLQS